MKATSIVGIMIFVLVFSAPVPARAERSITDFRVPPSSALSVSIAGGLSGGDHRSQFEKQKHIKGAFGLDLYGFAEDDNKALYADLQFRLDPRLVKDVYIYPGDTVEYFENQTELYQHLAALSYIKTSDFFGSLSGGGCIWWDYMHQDEKNYSHNIDGDFDVDFEFGYGRLRDGTNLWKALEIERILKEEEIIFDDLTSEDILAVAQSVNQLQKFALSHEKYEKYYYQELENRFQELGIGRVPAYVWFRIKEIIDFSVFPRRFGFRTGVGPHASGFGQSYYYQTDSTSSNIGLGDASIFGRFSFNSAYPITRRLQYDQNGYLDVNDKGINVNLGIDFDYRASLRIGLNFSNDLGYTYNGNTNFVLAHDLSFSYYLEDDMAFRCYATYGRRWNALTGNFDHEFHTGIRFFYYVW